MKRWAVIGPTGSGKSTVTALLEERGAVVVDGDRLGHEVLERPDIIRAVARRFGSDVLTAGQVSRKRLGRLVFADPSALADLNAITHPGISKLASERLDELEVLRKHELAVLEAAVYFLFPSRPRMDLVICVNSDPAIRRLRLARSAGLGPEEAGLRIDAQRHLDSHWTRADVTLANNGTLEDLKNAVDELWRQFFN